jgi:hypothetical protein
MYTPGPQVVPMQQPPVVQEVPQPQEKPKAPGKSKGETLDLLFNSAFLFVLT